MSIKCDKCGSVNNESAKFCAKCGQPIHNKFEIDKFKGFIPSSEYKNNVFVKILIFLMILLIVCWHIITLEPVADTVYNLCIKMSIDDIGFILLFLFLLFVWITISIKCWIYLIRLIKKGNIKNKCSLIERKENRYLRIAKNNGKTYKMGLFDGTRLKVLLQCNYDNITYFDDTTFLIKNKEKYGLYNCVIRKIIIPIEYDRISIYDTGIFTALNQSTIHHFDLKGRLLD